VVKLPDLGSTGLQVPKKVDVTIIVPTVAVQTMNPSSGGQESAVTPKPKARFMLRPAVIPMIIDTSNIFFICNFLCSIC
jgi:hypothetical protein